MSAPRNPFSQQIQDLRCEIDLLRQQQDAAIVRASHIGMSTSEAMQFDERRKRIYELYEAVLLVLKTNGSTRP